MLVQHFRLIKKQAKGHFRLLERAIMNYLKREVTNEERELSCVVSCIKREVV